MITGSIWEKAVFGKYLFARAFFWEDVFSILVLSLHTAYLAALALGLLEPRALMLLALAAYATYVVNASQFLPETAGCAPRRRREPRPTSRPSPGTRVMNVRVPLNVGHRTLAQGCETAPVLRERGQSEVFCGLTSIVGCTQD